MDTILSFQLGTVFGACLAVCAYEWGYRCARRRLQADRTADAARLRPSALPSQGQTLSRDGLSALMSGDESRVEDICADENVERFLDELDRRSAATRQLARRH